MFCDASQNATEIERWIKAVELGGADQTVHRGGPIATGIRPDEQQPPIDATIWDARRPGC